jgi:hypothetical protein
MAKPPTEPEIISVETVADYLEPSRQPVRTDDQKIADELLSLRLLAGYQTDKHGREQTSYLKSNSYEEKQARAALARCVRDNMKGLVGECLALAIDPYTASASPTMKPTRRVRFESPARGKSSTWARDLAIVHFIRKRLASYRAPVPKAGGRTVMPVPSVGEFTYVEVSSVSTAPDPRTNKESDDWKSDETAINQASDRYGLERSRIWEIWTRRKRVKPSAK